MRNKNQKGQALLENLLTHILLFLSFFAVLEMTRLLAFKSCLQSIVSDIATIISYNELKLKRNIFPSEQNDFEFKNDNFKAELTSKINKALENFSTSLFAFDTRKDSHTQNILHMNNHTPRIYLKVINTQVKINNIEYPTGIYLKVNTCLPVLFSGYFRFISKNDNTTPNIGNTVLTKNSEESDNNCIGEYTQNTKTNPLFWFRIRVAAYAPWPASSQVYKHGFPYPKKIYGINNEDINIISNSIDKINLENFFSK